ncbi:unnamed protein product [Medioppia subpectinata]|uniref:F-box domain-containing protein n=1 Tax=Medioppia subpectinata TaxID=1979941 RepID=A0A7R9Q6V0_9ACAR|nr:unnamed protein product [Medioppia subpectinata]CAG2115013.1 unnamed protein product [Medioppia subpectinata]
MSKDCFDRFGDDLSEVLLSYLSFEDRFRCESVSKQIQRVIFKTQTKLNIRKSKKFISVGEKCNDFTVFETILQKLPNITDVDISYEFDANNPVNAM